jgi:Cu(I)/Ag(I) efflux system membrane fusion protein
MTNPDHHPPQETPSAPAAPGRWQRAKFVFRAVEVRLRFVALFVVIGLVMAYWTEIENRWDRWTRPRESAEAVDPNVEYYCPMHPSVVRSGAEAGRGALNCPICGMPLSKRAKGQPVKLPAGVLTRVQLSPERVQAAGVETVEAAYRPLVSEVRAAGYVEHDESRLADIVTRVGGYLEKLYVDRIFQQVEAGQPLAEIYSPELYSGIQELRLAAKHSADLAASARQRLKLLGVNDAEIDEALREDNVRARLMIRSPRSGHVIETDVVEGASVEAGTALVKVADLHTVWVEADVFERDIPLLHEGQQAQARVEARPGQVFEGEIALVYPELALRPGMFATVTIQTPVAELEPFRSHAAERRAATATQAADGESDEQLMARQKICPVSGDELGTMGPPVKMEIKGRTVFLCCPACKDKILAEPDKYLAMLDQPEAPTGEVLAIPASAVIDTGTRKVVYVEREPGVFDGVEVQLGPRAGDWYAVAGGLRPGAKVAAAGAFLLDAETRLNPAAGAAYFGASGQEKK